MPASTKSHSVSTGIDQKRREYESRFDLGALFEFSKHINTVLDLKIILGRFLLTIMGKILSSKSVLLLGKSDRLFEVKEAKGIPSTIAGEEISIRRPPHRLTYVHGLDARKAPYISYFRKHGIDFLVPLIAADKVLGVAGFGSSISKKKLTDKEKTYIMSLANIAAAAIEKGLVVDELKQANRKLDGRLQELNTLFELGKEFNTILDPDRLVRVLTFSILGHVGVNRYFVCLNRNGVMQVAQSRLDTELDLRVFDFLCSMDSPVRVEKLRRGNGDALQAAGVRMLIPLRIGNETKGVIGIGERMHGGEYTHADIDFLSSLGNLAMISLENARLFQEAIEKQRMEDELLIARDIQRGLLPSVLPEIPHFDLAAKTLPSKQVGGDYYDVIQLNQHKFALAIGDVSGKGTPASLLMANLQATIRALVPLGYSLTELTQRVNDLICDNTTSGRFVTFFWGLLDAETRTMEYVNAGHNPPFLFRANGNVERLDKGGIILGVVKTAGPYLQGEVKLDAGDVLVLFTDGVSEAMNGLSEEFGEGRTEEIARDCLGNSSHVLLSRLVEAVQQHSKNVPQSDDITLMVLKSMP